MLPLKETAGTQASYTMLKEKLTRARDLNPSQPDSTPGAISPVLCHPFPDLSLLGYVWFL
jgi:hypothetical protein